MSKHPQKRRTRVQYMYGLVWKRDLSVLMWTLSRHRPTTLDIWRACSSRRCLKGKRAKLRAHNKRRKT